MGLLSCIIVGLIAGWLAGLVIGGQGYGFWSDRFLGIVGGLTAGLIAGAASGSLNPLVRFNLQALVVPFVGAVVVVTVYRAIHSRRIA